MQTIAVGLTREREVTRLNPPSTDNSRRPPPHPDRDDDSGGPEKSTQPFWMWFIENPRGRDTT
jgi:hypothetical protein